ncbi:Spt20p KNAG_0K02660 [Huiozyma naganishii CBS 8797]|uniref:Spt20-like SEP domain-containing protein n=1 Tax=Huiozyma naganishii (strain ATCC MYA-139 / BCRC 22969 / CBS 8797 / KCTC 17520 / NBRC 10181 / NCYC 3082 / Yp74L-3) TaxID=1071383 RepID=J7SAC2_HUIN7|nr:hypothetical protein KNAG_0K02660 [Kazachstania naganishii CBS 8797]CCK72629.1 hypothetical protein KNAG_0K02660 [Kazachstania naganishii CBS 8797]
MVEGAAFGIPVNVNTSAQNSPGPLHPQGRPSAAGAASAAGGAVNVPARSPNGAAGVGARGQPGGEIDVSRLDPQQRQRLLLQQRAMQQQRQQQALQNYEAQFYQLLAIHNKKPKRLYNFAENTDDILAKYEQYRPSFEFHIYESNYKICAPANTRLQQQQSAPELSNDGLVLNKNNQTLKEFLEYVARGRIPEAIMEVLRDSNIQFYEGNLILQVYDHTNTVDVAPRSKPPSVAPTGVPPTSIPPQTPGQGSVAPSNATSQSAVKTENPNVTTKKEQNTSTSTPEPQGKTLKRPRVYRTLLKPNDLTRYYDMMTLADQARFSDSIYQQLEAEVLCLTKRNLNLEVNLNPYEHRDKLDVSKVFTEPICDEDTGKVTFKHREESTRPGTKGVVGHIEEHEDLPQHSSNYEQLMLIMNDRTTSSTNSTFAAALAKQVSNSNSNNSDSLLNSSGSRNSTASSGNSTGSKQSAKSNQVAIAAAAAAAAVGSMNENNQFSRLKFIEQWRLNKEKRKQQQQSLGMKGANAQFDTKISMTLPLNPQQQLLQQQQQQQQQQQPNNQKNTKRGANKDGKPKPKKPRKTKKTAATDGGGEPTPKKKRPAKKKQTPADTQPSSTTNTPS